MDDLRHILPLLIPIIAIVMGIGTGMFSLWIDHRRKQTLLELNHRERLAALEHGRELPPLPVELLCQPGNGAWAGRRNRAPLTPSQQLFRGLFWTLLGAACATALWANVGLAEATWALIPLMIGLVWMAIWALNPARRTEW